MVRENSYKRDYGTESTFERENVVPKFLPFSCGPRCGVLNKQIPDSRQALEFFSLHNLMVLLSYMKLKRSKEISLHSPYSQNGALDCNDYR